MMQGEAGHASSTIQIEALGQSVDGIRLSHPFPAKAHVVIEQRVQACGKAGSQSTNSHSLIELGIVHALEGLIQATTIINRIGCCCGCSTGNHRARNCRSCSTKPGRGYGRSRCCGCGSRTRGSNRGNTIDCGSPCPSRQHRNHNRHHQGTGRAHALAAVVPAIVHFLNALPVHIAIGVRLFQPGQVRVVGDHAINQLANGLLIHVLDVDGHTFGGVDGQVALSHDGRLQQGFIDLPLTGHLVPGQIPLATLMGFPVEILYGFEGDVAAADDADITAAFQARRLVVLVAFTVNRQVSA